MPVLLLYRDIILDNKMDFTDIIKFFNGKYQGSTKTMTDSLGLVNVPVSSRFQGSLARRASEVENFNGPFDRWLHVGQFKMASDK